MSGSMFGRHFGLAVAAVLAVTAPAGVAAAQEGGWFYGGVSGGSAEYRLDEDYYAPYRRYPWGDGTYVDLLARDGLDTRQSESAWRVHVGYRANAYLALELGYVDAGRSRHMNYCPGNLVPGGKACLDAGPDAEGESDVSVRRVDAAVLGIVPVGGGFEAFGKLGLSRLQTESTWSIDGHVDERDYTSRLIGLGVRFHFAAGWSVRAEYDRTQLPRETRWPHPHRPGSADLDTIWLGLEYGMR